MKASKIVYGKDLPVALIIKDFVFYDIPRDYVVGLDILGPGELPKYNFISFSNNLLFLDVILTKNTQHIRHLQLYVCSVFARPPVINIVRPL